VRVDAAWVVLSPVVMWSLAVGYFPTSYPLFGAPLDWALAVAGALLLWLTAIVHQVVQLALARALGIAPDSITLSPTPSVDPPLRAWQELALASTGIAASLLLGVLLFWAALNAGDIGRPLEALLGYAAIVNLLVSLFHLIPGTPFDAGRVLHAALRKCRLHEPWASRAVVCVGLLAGGCLLALGAWQLLLRSLQLGLWSAIIGALIVTAPIAGSRCRPAG
jgi:Zn-dependent protease